MGPGSGAVEIELAGVRPAEEKAAREQLVRLLSRYDLSRWLFTKKVVIEAGALPHSHPVLTLSTGYLHDDADALGCFVHEQVHWGLPPIDRCDKALDEVVERWPKLPIRPPEGCGSRVSTYLHVLVNFLEYEALRELVGGEKAKQVLIGRRYYTAVYRLVVEELDAVSELFARHGVTLPPASG